MARLAMPYLTDYIKSIDDLELVVKLVPALQYTPILNTFASNLHSIKIKEASWRGKDIEVWPESSQIISKHAKYLKFLEDKKDSAR